MTSQPTKLKPQPNPPFAFRQVSDDRFTCYVVVVAVVLDNLGALIPASTVVTPVVFSAPPSIVSRNRPPIKLPLFSFSASSILFLRVNFTFVP
jgi:hypothetical protein